MYGVFNIHDGAEYTQTNFNVQRIFIAIIINLKLFKLYFDVSLNVLRSFIA